MGDENRLQVLASSSTVWFEELLGCAREWREGELVDFFLTQPWGEVGSAFVLGVTSRRLVELRGLPLDGDTVRLLLVNASALYGRELGESFTGRFEKILLLESSASLPSPGLETFLADALLLGSVLLLGPDVSEAEKVAVGQMLVASEELDRLRREQRSFLDGVMRGENRKQ